MCVILVAEKKALSKKMIRKANTANPHGLGVAWIEGKRVRYRKGITLAEVLALSSKLPLPYIVHARIKTEGRECGEMCHPFPITRRDDRKLDGSVKAVLFHNGHWGDWLKTSKRISKRFGTEIPSGDMSDSRAMAWIVAMAGTSILDTAHGQKFAVLSTEGVQLYGEGWATWNGYQVSNLHWVNRVERWVPTRPNLKTTKNWTSAAIPELGEDYEWVEEFETAGDSPKPSRGWYVVPRDEEDDDSFDATQLVLANTTNEAEAIIATGCAVMPPKKIKSDSRRRKKIKAANLRSKAKFKVTDKRRVKPKKFDKWIADWRNRKLSTGEVERVRIAVDKKLAGNRPDSIKLSTGDVKRVRIEVDKKLAALSSKKG